LKTIRQDVFSSNSSELSLIIFDFGNEITKNQKFDLTYNLSSVAEWGVFTL